jgi:hypothetical protein
MLFTSASLSALFYLLATPALALDAKQVQAADKATKLQAGDGKSKIEVQKSEPTQTKPGQPADKNSEALRNKQTPSLSELYKNRSNTPILKRRDKASEDDLRRELRRVPEIGLRAADLGPLLLRYETDYKNTFQVTAGVDLDPSSLLAIRPDFGRLPMGFRRIDGNAAAILARLSNKLRFYLAKAAPPDDRNKRPNPVLLRELMRVEQRGSRPEWLRPDVIPVLMQLLMHEDKPVRAMLIDLLAEIDGKKATVALAQRALVDLSPELREAAIKNLRVRTPEDYRPEFLRGLTYAWAPIADHAAEALVALQDKGAVPELIALLEKPDPGLPSPTTWNRLVVREVVSLQHMANCLMCHPPSVTANSPVPGIVPELTLRGVRVSGYGSNTTSRPTEAPIWIRADITFMQQDFGVTQTVAPLPGTTLSTDVRFDYVVRTRTVSPKAASELTNVPKKGEPSSQRQALLFALRELTGSDRGQTFAAWKPLLPEGGVGSEADKLVQQLVKASRDRRINLINKYRYSKDEVYGEALARAIPRLPESQRGRAREALADRLIRMNASDLTNKLQSDCVETRRAALVACNDKQEKSLVAEIIPLLDDSEPAIVRLAHRALKTLTNQDFGPAPNATRDEVAAALAAWNSWWKKQATPEQETPGGR